MKMFISLLVLVFVWNAFGAEIGSSHFESAKLVENTLRENPTKGMLDIQKIEFLVENAVDGSETFLVEFSGGLSQIVIVKKMGDKVIVDDSSAIMSLGQ